MPPEDSKEESNRFEWGALPAVAALENIQTRQRVIALLELLDQLVTKREELETAEETCKAELEQLQVANSLPGFKYGLLAFASQATKGRKSLDKLLLMENGVSAAIIQSSYVAGKPSVRRTFRKLPDE